MVCGCDIEAWLAARLRSRALEAKRSLAARAPVRSALPCPAPAHPVERPSGRKNERAEFVARAVADLPAAQRRTVELAYFGGLTVREIAAQRNEGEAVINRDLRAALDALRAALLPRGAVAGDTVGGP
jgi:RNA polymerase sigma-70 factor (ECF subfamily)